MTIPLQLPQINPPLAPRQPTLGEQIAPILEQITQQKIANAQLENYRSLAEERKAAVAKQARELQDQLDGTNAFYQHMSGAATRVKPEPPSKDGMPSHQGMDNTNGTLIPLPQFEKGLDPGALVHYHQLIQNYNQTVLQSHQATESQTRENLARNPLPDFQFRETGTPTGGTEIVGFNPRNPTETVGTGRAGPPDATSRRIPVVTEREKASAAVNAIRANNILNSAEASDPTIGQRVARKVAARKSIISGILHRVVGTSQEDANYLAEQQIEQSMSPEELEYYVAGKQWMGAVLPGLSGKQVTGREYMMQAPAYLSMGSGNPRVVANRRAARVGRSRGLATEAGDAMAERLAELQADNIDLSEYGLGPKRPTPSPPPPPSGPRARYHPQFNP